MSITSNHQVIKHVHKTPLLGQVLKDVMLICKPSLEGTLGRPIGLMPIGCGMFTGEVKSRPCEWMRLGDVWARGAVIAGKCMAYLWVPLKRVSYTCHGCKCFQAHS
jgi:hypothetical protein